jgi:sec-independent protein translocase protein TatC
MPGSPRAPGGQMTLVEHLTELRSRIIKSLLAIAVGTILGWVLYPHIFNILIHPYHQVIGDNSVTGGRLLQTDPLEGFAIRVKMATYSGIMFAMPVIMGAAIAYWTLPKALHWLIQVGGGGLITAYAPSKYFQLVIYMMLAFGVCFEFPVLLTFLQLVGVVRNATLRKYRRHAIVGITIVVAVATPSNDPISLLALSVPLVVFYEATIWIGWFIQRRRARVASLVTPA